ncbi:hypothetical protein Y032_0026g1353 [Ancylostoma ceylanicum]|uniref:Uncharacterized protein n=1 Tax=Ancylostoma ceylanicum TaxID=53326 RepID=A0A016UTK2_9BILA|nr:hypothetical protein Y032_0026g1353 [Ancylostoma ceylanicum]
MFAAVFLLGVSLLRGVGAYTVDDMAVPDVPHACIFLCKQGYKCVLVEPPNCVGCQTVPRCVQEECDTTCNVFCPFVHTCVLVETDCCPVPECRIRPITDPPPPQTIDFTNEPPNATDIVNPGGPIQHPSNHTNNTIA